MKKILILLVLVLSLIHEIHAQYVIDCSGGGGQLPTDEILSGGKSARQSSNNSLESGLSSIGVDGNRGGNPSISNDRTKTNRENQPWFEVDLGASYSISEVKAWFPNQEVNIGLKGYYIIFSEVPLGNLDLNSIISSEFVDYFYIDQPTISGQSIMTGNKKARYARLQYEGIGTSSFYEVEILGGPGSGGVREICDNGIDDDLDCKTDCEDPDCAPLIWAVNKINPTCPICNDGRVEIKAYSLYYPTLSYSINGGTTFSPCPSMNEDGWCVFSALSDGSYDIAVTNGVCTTFWRNNPVVIRSPTGIPNNCCNNGDFENGDFSNWTGGVGEYEGSEPSFSNTNIIDGSHTIITSGYKDPSVPFLPVTNGGSGTYLARLGDLLADKGAAKLKYCFQVEECNKNFTFNYLLVLEDPDHLDTEQPFFRYTIKEEGKDEIIKTVTRVSDASDPFFNTYIPNPKLDLKIAYTFWKCETTDLSDYLGKKLCIEFIIADCTEGGHKGYVYIDGLCNSPSDLEPRAILKGFNDVFCQNQDIIIDGTESYGYNQFGWKICELDGGQEIKCVEKALSPGGQIGIFNLEEFYNGNGNTLACGKTYRVSLILSNDCSDPITVSKDIDFLCRDGVVLAYNDIVNCAGEGADVEINGTIQNCSPCNIKWTPSHSSYLSNPNIPNPVIQGSVNVLALNQVYNIVATDPFGCIAEDDIYITNFHNSAYTVSTTSSFCDITLKSNMIIGISIPRGMVMVNFVNTTTGEIFRANIDGVEQNANSWSFSKSFPRNIFSSGNWQAHFEISSTSQTNCITKIVEIGQLYSTTLYYGGFNIAIPSGFTPNGDGTNDLFIIVPLCAPGYSPTNPVPLPPEKDCYDYGHNAYRGKMEIYNRWGQKIFEKEVFGTPDLPFHVNDLAWDGRVDGERAPVDTYIYKIELENCSFQPTIQCDNSNSSLCDPNSCECTNWTGEITIVPL